MAEARTFDVIVYGATGFTGRLVAEHMLGSYGVGRDVRWAMAGRNKTKLEQVRSEIGAPAELPLMIADVADAASVAAMAKSTHVVITTVGWGATRTGATTSITGGNGTTAVVVPGGGVAGRVSDVAGAAGRAS